MKRNKLLTLFAAVMILFGVQSANAFTLTCLRGDKFGEGEGCQKLFDGTENTKWGTWTGWYHVNESSPDIPYAIAKATMPIAPTTYSLKIANDTNSQPGRNWKSWRIFGGNFASDDAAVLNAEDWVLIDQKVDQEMTTDQFAEVQFDLSNPDGNFYSYFLIIVDAIVADGFGDYTQMDEFWFRDFTVDTSAAQAYVDFDYATGTDEDLKAAYAEKLTALTAAIEAGDPDQIVPAVDAIVPIYNKIISLRNGNFIALDWTAAWGDGPGSNLVDKNDYTKWGGNFPGEGEHVQYVVFRSPSQQPFFYKLVTGGDTERWNTRNWKTWKVFGGNFASEAEATRSAEGWVVLDERENISTDYLPNKNNYPATLKFTNGVTEAYSYYKVEVYASGGDQQQMSEIYLCSQEEFEAIRQSLVDNLAEFAAGLADLAVEADCEADKTTFTETYAQLQSTTDADELTILYNELVALKEALESSADFVAGGYRCLSGNTAWGDNENWTKLIDGDINTKWGGGMPEGGSYVIFKAYAASAFPCYELVTGNDTKNSPGRNWKNWKIYGANVKGNMDEQATRDYGNWELIDEKSNIGQDRLPAANFTSAYFNFSETWAKNYKYFKIEVEAAYDGGSIQMSEFKMLTEEEFAEIRQGYVNELLEKATALAAQYETIKIPAALMAQITTEAQALALAVTTATADELLPAYNAALNYMNVEAPALVADVALVPVDGVYQIASAKQLMTFAEVVNGGDNALDAAVVADINLADVITSETPWVAIGTPEVPFRGSFDGQGFAFTNFEGATPAATGKYGLFGNIEGATVKNFSIDGTLTVPAGSSNGSGVVGWSTSSTISNIYSTLVINAGGDNAKHVGGVVGSAQGGANTIMNCTFAGSLTVEDGSHDCFAGIVAYISKDKVINCANLGTIDYYKKECYAGGIVGYINNAGPTVANCLSVGAVTYKGEGSASYGGAIIGRHRQNAANVKNNYWLEGSAKGASGDIVLTAPAATSVTGEQLASGEVAYLLNGEKFDGDLVWFQDLLYKEFAAEQYVITADGTTLEPTTANVTLAGNGTTYTFTLPDFVLQIMGMTLPVGDISLEGVEIADDGTFNKTGTYSVPAANIPAALSAYATFFQNIPYTLTGKVNNEKLYAVIDMSLTIGTEHTVNVVAGTDDFEAVAPALTGDAYPVLDATHGIVYPVGQLHCDGSLYEAAATFTNNPSGVVQDAHDFVDGICSYCGVVDETYMTPNADGFYEIADGKQLQWFAAYVNQVDAAANGLVVADIDLFDVITDDELKFAVGTDAVPFTGVFDGGGHTLYDITYTAKGQYNGLFGKLAGSAVVKNFRAIGRVKVSAAVTGRAVALIAVAGGDDVLISNIYSDVYYDNELAGAQVGGILGGALNGYTTVDRCWYRGELDGNDAGGSGNYGGIVGYANNNAACYLTISNCLFDGKLLNTAASPGGCTFGGMIGYSNGANVSIKNCLSIGSITSPVQGQFFGAVKSTRSTIVNSYYKGDVVNGSASTVTLDPQDATQVTDEQLASGFVAARLAPAFRQIIGSGYPTLDTELPIVAEITSAGYATLYQEETDVEIPADVEVFAGVKYNDKWLKLNAIENAFAAGEPVILRGAAGYYMFTPTTGAAKAEANDLKGTAEPIDAVGKYVLAQPEGEEIGFYKAVSGQIAAGKAYLEDASGVKGFIISDEATGIAEVETTVENGAIYNLAGQRLGKMQKGINIVGNKKVLK